MQGAQKRTRVDELMLLGSFCGSQQASEQDTGLQQFPAHLEEPHCIGILGSFSSASFSMALIVSLGWLPQACNEGPHERKER